MRQLHRSLFGLCLLGMSGVAACGQERNEGPAYRLKPVQPGAQPIELKVRQTGWYSAASKVHNTDPRDGIGVRWNWPQRLGTKRWGAAGTVSLVAFPQEAVAYGSHRGMVLRLINRGKESARFRGCDSSLPIVQEARDERGRWREIEDVRSSPCGESYHRLTLGTHEYWEFAAPVYTGPFKTKIRFRLDAFGMRGGKAQALWIYSNEFDGAVTKAQLRMGPTQVEISKALCAKDASESDVIRTLVEMLAEDEQDPRRSHLRWQAVEHLTKLGPDAKEAIPALRKVRDETKGELRPMAVYAIWRIDGDTPSCVKALVGILKSRADRHASAGAANYLRQLGPAAREAVPELCWAVENGEDRTREMAVAALGNIHARPDVVVPILVKALQRKGAPHGYAAKALGQFGAEAKAAVPALLEVRRQALIAERLSLVEQTESALRKIDSAAAKKAGIR